MSLPNASLVVFCSSFSSKNACLFETNFLVKNRNYHLFRVLLIVLPKKLGRRYLYPLVVGLFGINWDVQILT